MKKVTWRQEGRTGHRETGRLTQGLPREAGGTEPAATGVVLGGHTTWQTGEGALAGESTHPLFLRNRAG